MKRARGMAPTISGSAGTPSTITEPEEAFLMGEADFLKFVQRCNEESLKVGLRASSPERCPLLECEEALREAEQLYVKND